MRHRRVLASILALALAVLSIGTATAWLSDSATLQYQISAASDFGDGHEDEAHEEVWVCKLTSQPRDPSVKEGKNPIYVGVDSTHAQNGLSDAHPSYIVESGDVECEAPDKEEEGENDNHSEEDEQEQRRDNDQPEGEDGQSDEDPERVEEESEADPDSTTTTTTTTETDEPTDTTTTTTSTTIPDSDQSTAPVTTTSTTSTSTTSTTTTTTIGSTGTDE